MQKAASNIILRQHGSGDGFDLKWGWFTFHLKIKALSARQLIAISGELSQLKDINKDGEMFPVLMDNSSDLIHISNAIAIATGTKWRRVVARAILKLDLENIQTLFKIVHKQSDPSPFFFITLLARGSMNLLEKKKE